MPNKGKTGKLRIIGGNWRGRNINFADAQGLRPTTDRVRETLFNWLQLDIHGSACLDLFAGSGALSFEAASRGASSVQMLEKNPMVCAMLRSEIDRLDATGQLSVVETDTLQWLDEKSDQQAGFDLVFLDPPFAEQIHQLVLDKLVTSKLLRADALVYLEMPAQKVSQKPATGNTLLAGWKVHRQKTMGGVSTYLLHR